MKYFWIQEYIGSSRVMKCHLCGGEFIKCPNSFRTHMRMHIKKKQITEGEELRLRKAIFIRNN